MQCKDHNENFAQTTQSNPKICEKCGEPIEMWIFMPLINRNMRVPSACACKREQIKLEEQRELNRQKLKRIAYLKSISLISKRYENVLFENTKTGDNPSFDKAFERCKRYCEVCEKVLENGNGIYLFGDTGTGKTHLTACIANELMKRGKSVLLTNLFEISKSIKSTFRSGSCDTEQQFFKRFESVSFVIFDDLGTEIFSKNEADTWLQALLFDLINKRYNAKKPTIFSSNYSLNELINKRGVSKRTVDRISEMTNGAVLKFEGQSLRSSCVNFSLPF